MKKSVLAKIGGKIFENPVVINPILGIILKYTQIHKISFYIICGGGAKVELLREKYKNDLTDKSDSEYHWNAIELMDKNTENLFKKLSLYKEEMTKYSDVPIHLINNISSSFSYEYGIFFIRSFEILQSSQNLEASWRISSDSISLFIASLLDLELGILIKDFQYISFNNQEFARIDAKFLQEMMDRTGYSESIVDHLGKGTVMPCDPLTPQIIKDQNIKCLILNGCNVKDFDQFLKLYPIMMEYDLPHFGTLIVP